ncbi:hypothetical protein HID58_093987 [Brassica napus]|uniref:Protein FAR1-RELATED SEQUENCE n=1 Tax=Brassica napus TaxID=3708 RepID=A0ABQ7X936_BRANA|nr:hypothetical protein HID58_093987 [Brassica napus]
MERSDSGDVDVQASSYLQTDETHERDDGGEADHEIDDVGFTQNEQRKSEHQEEEFVEGKEFDAPAVGMEFESYDDGYNYYNCYANEVGFRVRVKNSWFKRRSKEKYGAVLCCSSQGFKRVNDANRVRKETRTGCPAMVRMRQVDSKRWRVLEVTLDHNHSLGYKSVKRTGTKRKCADSSLKLYKARVMDVGNSVIPNSALKKQFQSSSSDVLNLRRGDSSAIYNYFCRMQLTTPNFFYLMDINDEGQLRNVFWADAFSRVSCTWGFMVHSFGIVDNEWLRSLYEDRARWAPVYLIDTFFAGLATCRPGESLSPFFERYVHKQTPLKEFLDKYELALHRKRREETLAELESLTLKTKCSFETQLSRVYTREMFKKFQVEVEEMYSCFSTTQVHVDGPLVIFLVKERVQGESNRREVRDFEVLYNRSVGEVRCICSCFYFYGYLCRHALCVLNFNGVEEIPLRYILPRWRKDYKRVHAADNGFVDGTDRAQRFDQLYKGALAVVEEGAVSLDRYKVAMQVLEQSLDRVHSVEEKQD